MRKAFMHTQHLMGNYLLWTCLAAVRICLWKLVIYIRTWQHIYRNVSKLCALDSTFYHLLPPVSVYNLFRQYQKAYVYIKVQYSCMGHTQIGDNCKGMLQITEWRGNFGSSLILVFQSIGWSDPTLWILFCSCPWSNSCARRWWYYTRNEI